MGIDNGYHGDLGNNHHDGDWVIAGVTMRIWIISDAGIRPIV